MFSSTFAPSLPKTAAPLALAQGSEEIYQRMRDRRARTLTESGGIAGIDPFDQAHGVYIWDWFTPDWNCPDRERIGPVGDGGKWTCGIDSLKSKPAFGSRCLMYSFGVRDDSRFELEVIKRVGCEVHAFDPTVGGLPADAAAEPRIHYHKQAVGPKSGHDGNFLLIESILDTMARLGHTWLDVLKIDVEASEWSVFEALFKAGKLPFSQILIELHYADPAAAFSFFDGMERSDFRIFARETNHQPCVAGRLPVAVEFSLIRSPLAQWPPPPALRIDPLMPRAATAAVWVMSHRHRLRFLVGTLEGLAKGFFVKHNLRGKYPLYIFAPKADIAAIKDRCDSIGRRADFEIQYVPVSVAEADWPTWAPSKGCSDGAGGKSYWQAEFEARTSLADKYEWLLRVGDDARLLKPVAYDPFTMMAEVGKAYGVLSGARSADPYYPSNKCFGELTDAAKRYAERQGIKPKRGLLLGKPPGKPTAKSAKIEYLPLLMNDQFEVSRSSLWRRGSKYTDFHAALSSAAGAHMPVYGDGPLQTMHAFLSIPEDQLHVFTDVGMEGRDGGSAKVAMGLPPSLPKSPLAKGGVLSLDGGFNGTNGTNATGPEYPRVKAAIYVLADGSRLGRLIEMLQSLDRHFNDKFHYPVVVFEEGLAPVQKARLSAASRAPLHFEPVDFRLPPWIEEKDVPMKTGCLPERGLGYRHMCRFQGQIVNLRLHELGYDWHWRMDDDSMLTGEITYDLFGYMAAHNKTYGYVSTVRDDDACIVSLWDTAKEYAERSGLLERHPNNFFDEWPRGAVFYNNFEISHVSLFTSPEYRAYFDYIDQSGGIYMKRWGDAPIKSIAVSLLVPVEKVHRFGDVGYRHAPFIDQEAAQYRKSSGGGGSRHTPPLISLAYKPEKAIHSVIGRYQVEALPDHELQKFLDAAVGGSNKWLGADIATSIPLGAEGDADKYLWLFGDTLIGSMAEEGPGLHQRVRRPKAQGGHLVHNSVGLTKVNKRTRKPSPMQFSWGQDDVSSTFVSPAGKGGDFVWPLGGLHICQGSSCKLVVVGSDCTSVRGAVASLLKADAFAVRGSMAIMVNNPQDDPQEWQYEMKRVPVPAYDGYVNWHVGIVRGNDQGGHDEKGKWAYMLGALGGWTKQVLARVPVEDLAKLDFSRMEAWSAKPPSTAPAWNLQSSLPSGDNFAKTLVTIGGVSDSSTEAGLYHDPTLNLWYMPFVDDKNHVVLRTAAVLTGPWSSHVVYSLPERWAKDPDYFAYAVKSHPELAAEGEIILTYNVNAFNDLNMARLFEVGEADTYTPQFLRLQIHS